MLLEDTLIPLAVFALLCITTGTLYQKRFVAACDVRTASAVQLFAALAVSAPLALACIGGACLLSIAAALPVILRTTRTEPAVLISES